MKWAFNWECHTLGLAVTEEIESIRVLEVHSCEIWSPSCLQKKEYNRNNDTPPEIDRIVGDSWDCEYSATLLNTLKTDILQIQNKWLQTRNASYRHKADTRLHTHTAYPERRDGAISVTGEEIETQRHFLPLRPMYEEAKGRLAVIVQDFTSKGKEEKLCLILRESWGISEAAKCQSASFSWIWMNSR